MSSQKKPFISRQCSYNSLYTNPLTELNHNRSSSEGVTRFSKDNLAPEDGENFVKNLVTSGKENGENLVKNLVNSGKENVGSGKVYVRDRALKPSSLQLCMQMNEPDFSLGVEVKTWEPVDSEKNHSTNVWDYSDSEAAPASSWSTLPNRSLLCRPLPVDIGSCTCVIVKEKSPEGLSGGTLYSLYTNEGQGRPNRKLAMAHHRRHNGRSEFVIAQKMKGIHSSTDDSFIGIITSNIMGSKYHILDQGSSVTCFPKFSKQPLAVVSFMPTIATWTGSYRSMRVWVPKHQSMQLRNTTQIQHVAGLPKDWEEKMDKVHNLFSKSPNYNKTSKKYELDYRDRGQVGLDIQSSVKNFQLVMEKNGKQTILQLGRGGKLKFIMDYRYPLTGFQAFCISLASIDSKLCCAL